MKFDVIIGNPPYQKSKYSDFYSCFFSKTAELLKEGGFFSMIAPSKGANPMSRAQKPLARCGWNRVEFGFERYFPNIATVIAHYAGQKGYTGEAVSVVVGGEERKAIKGTVFPLGTSDPVAYSVVEKIFNHQQKMPFVRTKQEPEGNYVYVSRLVGSYRPDGVKKKGGGFALKSFVNKAPELNDGGFLLAFNEEEAKQLAWLMSESLVMRFAVNQCGKAAFIPPLFWSLSPDLSQCKSNEDTFELLGFTAEEISYINHWDQRTDKK